MKKDVSAFALDNHGFRYALATSKGAELGSFSSDAQLSWKKSSEAMLGMIRRIKKMEPCTKISFLSLAELYWAIQKMLCVSYHP